MTLLPAECVHRLALSIDSSKVYELIGFDGTRSTAHAIDLDLIFVGRTFRGRYLLIEPEIGIIGRDIMNDLALILNGPELVWDLR